MLFPADNWGLIQVHWITPQSTLLCILVESFYLLIAATSVSLLKVIVIVVESIIK